VEEMTITADEALDDLRHAMGLPGDVWEHDDRTYTAAELAELLGLGDQATRDRAEAAVKEGRMVKGKVRGPRGHFVHAYRLAP